MAAKSPKKRGFIKRPRVMIPLAVLLALGLGGYFFWFGGSEEGVSAGTVYTVKRAPLSITVVEGGEVLAKESQEVKSEVEGSTKILSIVDEGYRVTPEDVENGLVLVELDSSELVDRQTSQELDFLNAQANYTEEREEFEIQINQNVSDIKAASLKAKFARMDLEKYLSAQVAGRIIAQLGIDETVIDEPLELDTELSSNESAEGDVVLAAQEEVDAGGSDTESLLRMESGYTPSQAIDFSQYADAEKLGDGEARQKLRSLQDDLELAREEVKLAETKLEGTRRLFDKDFVTKNELENDEIALTRKQIALDSAQTSMELFIGYEFPKQAEQLLSDYEESLRALGRARKEAVSELAQAEAGMRRAESQYEVQKRERDEIAEQIENCIIRAERPGLVVYGGNEGHRWGNEDRIQEGAQVRERQTIITIPDPTVMMVRVSIHESKVQLLEQGQKAQIKVDAFPDKVLAGYVDKISVLPDSQNRFFNPDIKVYPTEIIIEGRHQWLKPGMSAQAEIFVDRLDNVLQVPLQSVMPLGGEQVVFARTLNGLEPKPVEVGAFNDSFIEIKGGLEEGDVVLLRAPEHLRGEREYETESSEEAGPGAEEAVPGDPDAAAPGGGPDAQEGPGPREGGDIDQPSSGGRDGGAPPRAASASDAGAEVRS